MEGGRKSQVTCEEWLKLRKKTTILFVIESLLIGMDFSLTFLTLWLYINTLVKPKTPRVYYSIISAAFLVASLVISGFVGRMVDKTRNVKKTFFVMNTLVILGNLIYSVPASPWTLVIGRLLSGFGGPLRSVIAGELARCYHPGALSKFVSLMGMSYSFGFVVGPAFNFAFKDVEFTLGHWRVTFVNMPGLYMAALFFIVNCLSVFLLYDLSKIYDLKKETIERDVSMNGRKLNNESVNQISTLEEDEKFKQMSITIPKSNFNQSIVIPDNQAQSDENFINELNSVNRNMNSADRTRNGILSNYKIVYNYDSCSNKSKSKTGYVTLPREEKTHVEHKETDCLNPKGDSIPNVSNTLRKLFSRFDTTLILFLAFFESYFAVSFDMWIPMLVMETMNWSVTALNWIIIGVGVSCTIPCLILAFVTISDKFMYVMAMGCILSLAVMESIFIMLPRFNNNLTFDYLVWSVFCMLYALLVVMEEVFLVGCLAKMVTSSIQTFTDSIRLTMYRLGALVALMTSALVFQWIEIVACVHIVIILIGFIILYVRREGFMNPKIIIR